MSQHLTLLGLCAMAFYGLMLGTGNLSIEVMPQFLISAIIFLSSGRIMKLAARSLARAEEEEETQPKRREADWPWLTGLLNWTGALIVVGVMAIFLMKPTDLSLREAFSTTFVHEQFYAGAVP
jgi:hypothetical protein